MGCGLKVDEKPQFASFRFYETNSDLMFETSAKNFNQMFQSSTKLKIRKCYSTWINILVKLKDLAKSVGLKAITLSSYLLKLICL